MPKCGKRCKGKVKRRKKKKKVQYITPTSPTHFFSLFPLTYY
jgi:hypothetical protein